ncbi:MAG: DNRLRE domain-containing protein, partial [Bacteroidota bacterium]
MKKNLKLILPCIMVMMSLSLFTNSHISAQTTSSLVYLNGDTLTYVPYAMKGQTNAVNIIPDFSKAGYKGGGVALPDVPVKQTVSPVSGDDRASIQSAIDAVEALPLDANGFRGAVLLTAGDYQVDGQLFIEASGVVLRGEGQGTNGTVIHADQTSKHDFLIVQGTGSGITENTATTQSISSTYVPVGAISFDIANASGFSIGDTISVKRTPNQFWIDELAMGQYGWTASSYAIKHERIIEDINGNTITINIPIVDVMETQYGGGEVSKATIPGRIQNCGVENLRIESYYASNTDENHAWSAVRFSRVVNSWVKKVTGQYLGYGTIIVTNESNFNTFEECASKDHKSQISGGRRYSFTIKDGVGNLFQRCYTKDGRHDFETGSRVTGPNVFLDSYSANTYSDIGPHHRWSTGILFDNIRGGQIRVHNRGSSGTGHGWVGNSIVFWNLLSYKNDIKVSSPEGGRNFGIGCSGLQQNGDGYWEDWNNPVVPRSLYLQQLEDRLGSQALDNILIDAQKTGNIYTLLSNWAGEGELVPTVQDSSISPVADAFVRGGTYTNDNYGTSTQLVVKENSGSADNDRMSFLKFDLSTISGTVSSAKIRLKVQNDDPGASHQLHFISDDSWTETGITWSNKPSAGSVLSTQTVPVVGEWIEFDVTAQVNSELAGDGTISVQLSESSIDNYVVYHSREVSTDTDRPQLVYELAPPPNTLSNVADAFVRGGTYANNNYGTNTQLVVKDNAGSADNDRMSFLKFDLSTVTGTVASAKIRLKVQNDDPGASHQLHFVSDDSWTETGITWNNQPSTGALIGTETVPAIGEWIEFEVTSQVNGELFGDGTLSVRVSESSIGTYAVYHAREVSTAEDRPQLVYELAPQANSLSNVADAYVRGGTNSNNNYGTDTKIVVKENAGTANNDRMSFLKFDLGAISGSVTSAKIRLKVQNDDSGASHNLYLVSNDTWTETGITWSNKPSAGSLIGTATVPAIGEWIEFDVTSEVNGELTGDGTISLQVSESSIGTFVAYHAREATNPDDRPVLVYTEAVSGNSITTASEIRTPIFNQENFRLELFPNPVFGG